jgi:adenylyltransferase/sulfurtransferase
MIDRYSRQTLFIGEESQNKLSNSHVTIIGCGALGSIIATSLVRAGVGKIKIVDRDFIEYHNLQRQVIFDEEDIKNHLPKAIAAERHLKKVNSSIGIEGIVADVNYTNIEKIVHGTDLILDGLDNFETRLLINDVSLKHNIPWVYGGAISALGMTMTIIPHETPCFLCVTPDTQGRGFTCDTAGVINPAPFIIGSLESAEAMKILTGVDTINRDLLVLDVWKGVFNQLIITPQQDCPACKGMYNFLKGQYEMECNMLCGQTAVQVINPHIDKISLEELAKRLKPLGKVIFNRYMLSFTVNGNEMVVFPDGRTIIKNTQDKSLARGLYAKYIGL